MQKYGIKNFIIECLEECSNENASEREKYWIESLGSFKYGYNATLGGDGKPYVDTHLILFLWNNEKLNVKEIHQITGYDTHTISQYLKDQNVLSEDIMQRGRKNIQKPIAMLDISTDEIIQVFSSIQEAYNFLNKQHSGHIADVCKGKRKSAYGYKWEYIKDMV